ncbi:MAG: bacteriohemerythrin [Treponema sp.]
MKNFVSWNSSYDLGIDVIDKQHRHLVNLMNQLYNACLEDKGVLDETFKLVMKELVDYVLFHFSAEEKLMESIHYTELKAHKQTHEHFIREVLASVQAYQKGKQLVPNTFVRFLRDWLFNHILLDDKAWARHYFAVKT